MLLIGISLMTVNTPDTAKEDKRSSSPAVTNDVHPVRRPNSWAAGERDPQRFVGSIRRERLDRILGVNAAHARRRRRGRMPGRTPRTRRK
jgi:hypothetical protein